MTNYLRVRNFEQLQHYKDRDPPWIKLYYRMLDDYAFTRVERRYDGFAKPAIDPAVAAAAKGRADRLPKRGNYAERYE